MSNGPVKEALSSIARKIFFHETAPVVKKVATSALEQPEIYYFTDLGARSPKVFPDHGPFEDSREESFLVSF